MLIQLVEEDQVTHMTELLAQIINFKSNWGKKENVPQVYLLNSIWIKSGKVEECFQTCPLEKKVGRGRWITHCDFPSSCVDSGLTHWTTLLEHQILWTIPSPRNRLRHGLNRKLNPQAPQPEEGVSQWIPTWIQNEKNLRWLWVGTCWIPVHQSRQTVPSSSRDKDFIAFSSKLLQCFTARSFREFYLRNDSAA